MGDVVVREATEDDIEAILDTLRLALGETPLLRRTPQLWAWKHIENPFGRSIVMVADSNGTIAGVRAMMRWELISATGHTIRCVRPVDTATHPQFVRQGIFRTLTMTALETVRAQKINLVFNTPNDKSARGYLAMGWEHVSWIGAQVRPRFGTALRPSATEPPTIPDLAPSMDSASAIPDEMEIATRTGMRTVRNGGYVGWRFRRHPTASYGWVEDLGGGGMVARASARGPRSELVVSDFLGSPSSGVIGSAARMSKARYLAGWFSPNTAKRTISVRGGLIPVPGTRTLRLVALPLSDIDCNPFDLGSWDLATSDLELL